MAARITRGTASKGARRAPNSSKRRYASLRTGAISKSSASKLRKTQRKPKPRATKANASLEQWPLEVCLRSLYRLCRENQLRLSRLEYISRRHLFGGNQLEVVPAEAQRAGALREINGWPLEWPASPIV